MSYPPPMGPENRGWPPAPGSAPGPSFEVGAAITYGWNKFKDNAGWWILLVVLYGAISLVLSIPGGISRGISTTDEMPVNEVIGFGSAIEIVFTIISWAVGILFSIVAIKGALLELDGRKPEFADFFKVDNWGQAILAALLVTVLTSILPLAIFAAAVGLGVATGSIGIGLVVGALGFIVLLVLAFLTYFTIPFALDKRLSPVQAVRSSVQLISKNVGPLLLLALAVTGILIVGALACLIGLLVAMPLTTIATTYAYRLLTNGTVSPVAQGWQQYPQAKYPQGQYPQAQYPPQQPYPPQYPQAPYPPQQPYGGGFPQQPYPPQQPYGGFPPQTTYGGNYPPAEPPQPPQPQQPPNASNPPDASNSTDSPQPPDSPEPPDSPNPWQPLPGGGFPPDKT